MNLLTAFSKRVPSFRCIDLEEDLPGKKLLVKNPQSFLLLLYLLLLAALFLATVGGEETLARYQLRLQSKELLEDLKRRGVVLWQKEPNLANWSCVEKERFERQRKADSSQFSSQVYLTLGFEENLQQYCLHGHLATAPWKAWKRDFRWFFARMHTLFFLFWSFFIACLQPKKPLKSSFQIVSKKSFARSPVLEKLQTEQENVPSSLPAFRRLSIQFKRLLHRLRRERTTQEALLKSMAEGALSLSRDLEILYANPAAYQILKITKKDFSGPCYDRLRSLCSSFLASQDALQNQSLRKEFDLMLGSQRVCLDVLMRPGLFGGLHLLLRDKGKTGEFQETKKIFLTNASHELRTPLTVIQGFAEMILEHQNEISAETLQEIIKKVVKNCQKMNALITELLNLSKVENFPLEGFVPLDLIPIVENTLAGMRQIYPNAKILFAKEMATAPAFGNELLLGVAIRNLIENSVKYSQENPKIEVSLRSIDKWLELSFADNGIGIAPGDLPYIFERFYRADRTRSKKREGYGLGLAMVQNILRQHGALIEVESVLEKGSCFRLRFALQHDSLFG